jgi:hypothetical protein
MSRVIYELVAEGNSLNGWKFTRRCSPMFEKRSDAEAEIPLFRQRCVDRKQFECADDDADLKIEIVERSLK